MTTHRINVRELELRDREAWIELRASLWPEDRAEVVAEALHYFEDRAIAGLPHAVFVAEAGTGTPAIVGFAECSLRELDEKAARPGRRSHLEGWFVLHEWRRREIGRRLVSAVMEWARLHGCSPEPREEPKQSACAGRQTAIERFSRMWIAPQESTP